MIPKDASDRVALMLTLVPYLLEHQYVKVSNAASHFGVQPEVIRNAIHVLLVSEHQDLATGQWTEDMFDIDWDAFEEDDEIALSAHGKIDDTPRFSTAELAALLTGLNYLASLPDHANNVLITNLFAKMRAAAGGNISDSKSIAMAAPPQSSSLPIARQAIEQKQTIEFEYVAADGNVSTRVVDPIKIDLIDDVWYLRAWCHTREELRNFRLERIRVAQLSSEPRDPRADSVQVSEWLIDRAETGEAVTLEVATPGIPLLGDFVADTDIPKTDPTTVTVSVVNAHSLKRIVTAHPHLIRILSGKESQRLTVEWAKAGLSRYE